MTSPNSNNTPLEKNVSTLKEMISRCCKRVEIGCAVLPKPLLDPDVDEDEFDARSNTLMSGSREGVAPKRPESADLGTLIALGSMYSQWICYFPFLF